MQERAFPAAGCQHSELDPGIGVPQLFRESKVLKVIMTIMSLCTFIMIASSVMRMTIYIRYYYLTFLRIFVLWMLAVLFVMFIGVLINIYRESFPLFRYGVVMVTVLYLALSFSHPDYIIARVNIANAPGADGTGWEESVAQDYGDDFSPDRFSGDRNIMTTLI